MKGILNEYFNLEQIFLYIDCYLWSVIIVEFWTKKSWKVLEFRYEKS